MHVRLLLACVALALAAPGHAADKKYGERPTIEEACHIANCKANASAKSRDTCWKACKPQWCVRTQIGYKCYAKVSEYQSCKGQSGQLRPRIIPTCPTRPEGNPDGPGGGGGTPMFETRLHTRTDSSGDEVTAQLIVSNTGNTDVNVCYKIWAKDRRNPHLGEIVKGYGTVTLKRGAPPAILNFGQFGGHSWRHDRWRC